MAALRGAWLPCARRLHPRRCARLVLAASLVLLFVTLAARHDSFRLHPIVPPGGQVPAPVRPVRRSVCVLHPRGNHGGGDPAAAASFAAFDRTRPDYRLSPAAAERPAAAFVYRSSELAAAPLVSIVVPYFRGELFPETLRSLQRQSLQQWELIVVDDQAPVGSAAIRRQVHAVFEQGDPRLRFLRHKENQGLSAARNTGFAAARAANVLMLDTDDLVEPTALEKCLWLLLTEPNASFVKGFTIGFGALNYTWNRGFRFKKEFLEHNTASEASMIRRSTWEAVGGFDEALRRGMEDYDFWLHAGSLGLWGATITEVVDWYRRKTAAQSAVDWPAFERPPDFRTRYPALFRRGLPAYTFEPVPPFANAHARASRQVRAVTERALAPAQRPLALHPDRLRVMLFADTLGQGSPARDGLLAVLIAALAPRGRAELTVVLTGPGCAGSNLHDAQRLTPDVFCLLNFLGVEHFPLFMQHLLATRRPDIVLGHGSRWWTAARRAPDQPHHHKPLVVAELQVVGFDARASQGRGRGPGRTLGSLQLEVQRLGAAPTAVAVGLAAPVTCPVQRGRAATRLEARLEVANEALSGAQLQSLAQLLTTWRGLGPLTVGVRSSGLKASLRLALREHKSPARVAVVEADEGWRTAGLADLLLAVDPGQRDIQTLDLLAEVMCVPSAVLDSTSATLHTLRGKATALHSLLRTQRQPPDSPGVDSVTADGALLDALQRLACAAQQQPHAARTPTPAALVAEQEQVKELLLLDAVIVAQRAHIGLLEAELAELQPSGEPELAATAFSGPLAPFSATGAPRGGAWQGIEWPALSVRLLASSAEVSPTGLQLGLLFEATAPATGEYNVFVHVVDAKGVVAAKRGGVPRSLVGTAMPRSTWRPDEPVLATVQLAAAGALEGLHSVFIGWSYTTPALEEVKSVQCRSTSPLLGAQGCQAPPWSTVRSRAQVATLMFAGRPRRPPAAAPALGAPPSHFYAVTVCWAPLDLCLLGASVVWLPGPTLRVRLSWQTGLAWARPGLGLGMVLRQPASFRMASPSGDTRLRDLAGHLMSTTRWAASAVYLSTAEFPFPAKLSARDTTQVALELSHSPLSHLAPALPLPCAVTSMADQRTVACFERTDGGAKSLAVLGTLAPKVPP